jgi:hypothetical protein
MKIKKFLVIQDTFKVSIDIKGKTQYSVSILFVHEEGRTWARLASPAIRRKHVRVQTKC